MEPHCTETVATNKALSRLQSASRVLSVVFLIVFAVLFLLCIAAMVLLTVGALQEGMAGDASFWVNLISTAVSCIAFQLVVFCLFVGFRSIGRGHSPFTKLLSRLILVIGVLFLIIFIAELLSESSFSAYVYPSSDIRLGIVDTPPEKSPFSIFVDIKALSAAVVCFCLSRAFSYGRMLQEVNDGTV